jgi:hypothetical protein
MDVRAAPTYISASDAAERRPDGPVAWQRTTLKPHHTTILIFLRPRALANTSDRLKTWQKYRAWVVRRNPSDSERTSVLIPLNHTNTILGRLKALKTCAGFSGPTKACPQRGSEVLPGLPYHVGRRPTSCVALQGPGASVQGSGDAGRSATSERTKTVQRCRFR